MQICFYVLWTCLRSSSYDKAGRIAVRSAPAYCAHPQDETPFRTNRFSSAAKQMKNASEEALSFVLRTGFEPVTHGLEILGHWSYIRVCGVLVTKMSPF